MLNTNKYHCLGQTIEYSKGKRHGLHYAFTKRRLLKRKYWETVVKNCTRYENRCGKSIQNKITKKKMTGDRLKQKKKVFILFPYILNGSKLIIVQILSS